MNDLKHTISSLFKQFYGTDDHATTQLEQLLAALEQGTQMRSAELKAWDIRKTEQPDWFLSAGMVGYSCYVDRFADTVAGVTDKVDYIANLGIRYLHLLPLMKTRPGENDGGFAVSDYTNVNPRLGTMQDLRALCDALRQRDICLCIDLVLNHTADDHAWALAAKSGDEIYRDYYITFDDPELPKQYEKHLDEVFPSSAPGNFTWSEALGRWVWTTFYTYQWDLNFRNPAVFVEIVKVMIELINVGIGAFRMDAVPFLWKEMGTKCHSLPQVHEVVQMLRQCLNFISPAVLFKAESIVPTKELGRYLGAGSDRQECQLAYNNILMLSLWEGLARQDISALPGRMDDIGKIPDDTTWLNYLRCHDEIIWSVFQDAQLNSKLAEADLQYLADFFAGDTRDSFALGKKFQSEPGQPSDKNTGMTSALVGLEMGLWSDEQPAIEMAIRRYKLIYSVLFAFPGIPLVWMGDEIGLGNDYGYENDPAISHDDRWLNRPHMNWNQVAEAQQGNGVRAELFQFIQKLARLRKSMPALHASGSMRFIETGLASVLFMERAWKEHEMALLANFSAQEQPLDQELVERCGMSGWENRLGSADKALTFRQFLAPYEVMWLSQA